MQAIDEVSSFAQSAGEYGGAPWEMLPDIGLYMDQVIMYINRQQEAVSDTPMTGNMVNNYVKDGLVRRPEQKRYSREHIASLLMISGLKPVLQMPDIACLLSSLDKRCTARESYTDFCLKQSEALSQVMQRVEEACSDARKHGRAQLEELAMSLALEASARRIAAEKILSLLKEERENPDA